MKRKINLLIMVLFDVYLYWCSNGTDYIINLNDGYEIIKTSTDFISISKSDINMEWSYLTPKKIVEVSYNDEYIISKQFDVLEKDDKFFVDELKENYWMLDIRYGNRDGIWSFRLQEI